MQVLGESLSLLQEAGLLIQRVADDSPGQRFGLRQENMPVEIAGKHLLLSGDIVLEIKGVAVSADFKHTCEIGQKAGGINHDNLEMKVLRDGKVVEVPIFKQGETLESD